MLHSKTHEYSKTIRGMKLKVTLKAPDGATVGDLLAKIEGVFAYAEKDPDQFNLPLDAPDPEQ